MIIVTGLLVSPLILSRIGWPHPGFFVSTTTTPLAPTNTAVLPPPPLSTNRLSLSFSTSTTFGAGGCWYAATASVSEPTASSTTRTMSLLIASLQGGTRLDRTDAIQGRTIISREPRQRKI